MRWIIEALEKVREKRPLVHNITNYVVMNTTANALLAIGASPVMAHAIEELEEMVALANTLVINIGTLDEHKIYSMMKAVKTAKDLKKPVILDPVGAGATKLRTKTSLRILEAGEISVIRGNFGEIAALLGEHGKTRGVDSAVYDEQVAKKLARDASKEFNTVVAVTGPVDYVSDGEKVYAIENGTPLLGRVTGTGCMATAIIGAFLAVEDPLKATIAGLISFEIAAEKAFEDSPYPGTFHTKLYDWLYRIDGDLIMKRAKVKEVEL
ncbi:hydroxyethylthiazole kinase [Thermococcus argininiproducens]|uniref:Hydroxyethylthiazole kinase n=1 Tax=Thermococcus argininiproducens TaxID=2866384 RepID=A0A9E7SBL3_9EURY|nr:hydroxyethylthiazole kinase [Thermococcus argininiproducens]USG99003.1 hydroxyethylthiazole kinase [Thermococcus argininiproducens]